MDWDLHRFFVAVADTGDYSSAAERLRSSHPTVGRKIADMRQRRDELGLPPLTYGIAGYAIVRDSEAEAKREVERITNVKQSARGYANYEQWVTGSKLHRSIEAYLFPPASAVLVPARLPMAAGQLCGARCRRP